MKFKKFQKNLTNFGQQKELFSKIIELSFFGMI